MAAFVGIRTPEEDADFTTSVAWVRACPELSVLQCHQAKRVLGYVSERAAHAYAKSLESPPGTTSIPVYGRIQVDDPSVLPVGPHDMVVWDLANKIRAMAGEIGAACSPRLFRACADVLDADDRNLVNFHEAFDAMRAFSVEWCPLAEERLWICGSIDQIGRRLEFEHLYPAWRPDGVMHRQV